MHRCDEASCMEMTHWVAGTVQANTTDWSVRRHSPGSPLRDTRGPRGRALALRNAALTGHDLDEEAAVGMLEMDRLQSPLW